METEHEHECEKEAVESKYAGITLRTIHVVKHDTGWKNPASTLESSLRSSRRGDAEELLQRAGNPSPLSRSTSTSTSTSARKRKLKASMLGSHSEPNQSSSTIQDGKMRTSPWRPPLRCRPRKRR